MQGAPKRQVNAEEMLAELKRALESSPRAPDAPSPSAPTVSKSSSPGREGRRAQIDKAGDRPAQANAGKSIGQPTELQKSTRPRSRRWKLTAGGLALASLAAVGGSFALMNKAPDLPTHEPSVAATESLVRPQSEQTLEPSSDSRSAAPAFTPGPLNQAATLVTSHRIGPDGAPIATAPPTAASLNSAPPLAQAPKTAAPSAPAQAITAGRRAKCDGAAQPRFAQFSAASGSGAKDGGPLGACASDQEGRGANRNGAVRSRCDRVIAVSG